MGRVKKDIFFQFTTRKQEKNTWKQFLPTDHSCSSMAKSGAYGCRVQETCHPAERVKTSAVVMVGGEMASVMLLFSFLHKRGSLQIEGLHRKKRHQAQLCTIQSAAGTKDDFHRKLPQHPATPHQSQGKKRELSRGKETRQGARERRSTHRAHRRKAPKAENPCSRTVDCGLRFVTDTMVCDTVAAAVQGVPAPATTLKVSPGSRPCPCTKRLRDNKKKIEHKA